MWRFHFSADTPLAINALLFVPKDNFESIGLGRMDPGVNLHCRWVLIDQHSKSILPEWLRFLKGVVDSEDLPLRLPDAMEKEEAKDKLADAIQTSLCKWMMEVLGEKVKDVKPSTRLVDSPAMIYGLRI